MAGVVSSINMINCGSTIRGKFCHDHRILSKSQRQEVGYGTDGVSETEGIMRGEGSG